jgi:UDP-N-acetylmuramate dehydrogenase
MARHTSFRVGGPAAVFLEPRSLDELVTLVRGLQDRDIPVLVLGGGSNVLVRDGGLAGALIRLRFCMPHIEAADCVDGRIRILAGAGASLSALCRLAIRRGCKGLNRLIGIPGSVGGALAGNAGGAQGWISDVVASISILMRSGKIVRESAGRFGWAYRSMHWPETLQCPDDAPVCIVSAEFVLEPDDPGRLRAEAIELLDRRKRSQPLGQASAGCIFKNPPTGPSAGYLIDRAGMKGLRVGGAEVSRVHANFIVNVANASAEDISGLIDLVRQRVMERWGVCLQNEILVLRQWPNPFHRE